MSTLLKLLDKIKQPTKTAGVNPNLREAVNKTQGKTWSRERTMRIVLLALVAILLGGGVLYYLEFIRPPAVPVASQRPRPEPVQLQQSSARTVAAEAVQPQLSTAQAVPVPVLAPTVAPAPVKVAPAVPKPVAKAVRAKPKPVLPKANGGVPTPAPIKPAAPPAVIAKTHDPALRDSYLLAARSAEQRRDLYQAIKLYRKAVDADPDNYRILTNIAGLNIQLGNFSEALSMAQQALAQRPEFLPALVNRGIAAARLGKDQDAVGSFSQALTIEPTNRGALYNLALLRERSGATAEAATLYRRLMETGDGKGYLGAGRLEEQQRRPAEARRLYHALLALSEVPAVVRGAAKERLQALE